MKKNFILAIVLSLLAVTSTGCGLVAELIEGFDSVMSNSAGTADEADRNNNSKKDENSDSASKNPLSEVLKLDEDTDEKATETTTEAITEYVTEAVTEALTENIDVEAEESTEPVTNSEDSEIIQASEPATEESSVTPADSNVLYNEAGLKITYIDCVEKYGSFKANMSFENSSDVDFEVQVRDVYVNGKPVSAIMSVSTEIGNTIDDCMKINVENLKKAGINTSDIKTIEFSFHIFDWSNKAVSIDTPSIKINI